jgi:hypothetical protein
METFTQPKITGYRQLSEAEAALINEIKAKGAEIEALLAKVDDHLTDQYLAAKDTSKDDSPFDLPEEIKRIDRAQPRRWAAIGRTHFQEGLMALTRAVAQPSSF